MTERQWDFERSQVDNRRFKWSSKTLWGYGFGHVQCDLTGAMWYGYLLVYLEKVIGLSPSYAGYILTMSQIVEGIAVLSIGLGLDKVGVCGNKYPQRKSWHLLGTILMAICFPFMYSSPPGYDRDEGNWSHLELCLYFVPFVVIRSFSYAAAQISHLSLIPCLTRKDSARVQLTSLRNAFGFLTNIVVYICTYIMFSTSSEIHEVSQESGNSTDSEVLDIRNCTIEVDVNQVGWDDRFIYLKLGIGAVVIGTIFQGFVFHFLVDEPPNELRHQLFERVNLFAITRLFQFNNVKGRKPSVAHSIKTLPGCQNLADAKPSDEQKNKQNYQLTNATKTDDDKLKSEQINSRKKRVSLRETKILKSADDKTHQVDNWFDWFKCPLFYMVALQYCFTQLLMNLTISYLPHYLQESLKLPKEYIATIPMLQFITGFAVSFAMKPLSKLFGKRDIYTLGCIFIIAGAISANYLGNQQVVGIYFLGVIFGAGRSTIFVQSLAIIAELIGTNSTSAAFVYGAMCFTEKIATAGSIFVIQSLSPCNNETPQNGLCGDGGCGLYYRHFMSYGIGSLSGLAVLSNILRWYYAHKQ